MATAEATRAAGSSRWSADGADSRGSAMARIRTGRRRPALRRRRRARWGHAGRCRTSPIDEHDRRGWAPSPRRGPGSSSDRSHRRVRPRLHRIRGPSSSRCATGAGSPSSGRRNHCPDLRPAASVGVARSIEHRQRSAEARGLATRSGVRARPGSAARLPRTARRDRGRSPRGSGRAHRPPSSSASVATAGFPLVRCRRRAAR